MSPVECDHIVGAFSFELGKCNSQEIRERMLGNLANVAAELCAQVSDALGLPPPSGSPAAEAADSAALSIVPALYGREGLTLAVCAATTCGTEDLDRAGRAGGAGHQ